MSTIPKLIFINGVATLNPDHPSQKGKAKAKGNTDQLAVVSSMQDIMDTTEAQREATGEPMKMAASTQASMEIIQDEDYLSRFRGEVDGYDLLEDIGRIFDKYEVPIGLINKLQTITEYGLLNFIVDDSGSMGFMSNILKDSATEHVRAHVRGNYLTRWNEVEDRIHILLDMLAYIPFNELKIRFLNSSKTLTLTNTTTPQDFLAMAHGEVSRLFNFSPRGGTPMLDLLKAAFASRVKTMHYLFTDGMPDQLDQVKAVIANRDTAMHPLTLVSCTEDDRECAWMKDIEEKVRDTSEIDDFESERKEVLHDQGNAFPYTRGFWLISLLCSAINPYDLDALDESVPFTKFTLDNLMGREVTAAEYRKYWDLNPNAPKYSRQFNEFSTLKTIAADITGGRAMAPPAYTP